MTTWTYSARRRVFVYVPASVVGAFLFLVVGYPLNSITVLGGALMIFAAVAAAFDNNDDLPAAPAGEVKDHA